MKLRTISAVTFLALALAACADASPGSGGVSPTDAPGATGSPAGADHLLLRVASEGGFVPPEYTLGAIPAFSLFADGTLITPGAQTEIYPGPALPSMQAQILTQQGIDATVQAAIDAGASTADDMVDFASVGIADATTTVITIEADGTSHTVRVYALGELTGRPPGMSAAEFEARNELQALVADLTNLDRWLPSGSIGQAEPYDASGARLYVSDYTPDKQLHQDPVGWPLATPLADVGKPTTPSGFRCAVVSGQDWTTVLRPEAANANALTPWTSGGDSYAIVFRPLLPDEPGC